RRHPRSSLLMPRLSADRLPAARVRLALSSIQPDRDRTVSHRALTPGANARSLRASSHALPARPVLGAPFPRAGSRPLRRLRRLARGAPPHSGPRLRPPRPRPVGTPRLAGRAWLPVRGCPLRSAGLAARSASRRPPRRILLRRGARLSLPTHHLHGTPRPFSLRLSPGEKHSIDGRQG